MQNHWALADVCPKPQTNLRFPPKKNAQAYGRDTRQLAYGRLHEILIFAPRMTSHRVNEGQKSTRPFHVLSVSCYMRTIC